MATAKLTLTLDRPRVGEKMKSRELTGVGRGSDGRGAERRRNALPPGLPASGGVGELAVECGVPVVALRGEEEGAGEKCERMGSSGPCSPIYRHRWRRGARISRTHDLCNRSVWRGNGACSAERGGAQPSAVPRLIRGAPNRRGTESQPYLSNWQK